MREPCRGAICFLSLQHIPTMTRSLLVAAVLFPLLVFCNGAPTKPSYSKENQADITMIEILNGGNITLSDGKQW